MKPGQQAAWALAAVAETADQPLGILFRATNFPTADHAAGPPGSGGPGIQRGAAGRRSPSTTSVNLPGSSTS